MIGLIVLLIYVILLHDIVLFICCLFVLDSGSCFWLVRFGFDDWLWLLCASGCLIAMCCLFLLSTGCFGFFIWRLWIWWIAILIVGCGCVWLYVGLVFILGYVVCFCFNGVVMLCIGAVCFALLVLCGLFCIWWFALLFCLWLCWLFVFVCFVVKRYLVDCFMVLGLCLIVVVRVSSVCCLFEFVFWLFWVVY